jgi:hypothetical protein
LKEELQKSRELQDNVRQLQGTATEAMDSEAMKKAKAVYERARVGPPGSVEAWTGFSRHRHAARQEIPRS